MMKKKNTFEIPEAIIFKFEIEDIITSSKTGGGWYGEEPGDHDQD